MFEPLVKLISPTSPAEASANASPTFTARYTSWAGVSSCRSPSLFLIFRGILDADMFAFSLAKVKV